jgi:small-conductance mechanosensitive channel
MLYSSLGLLETSISPALAYVGAIAASVVLAVPESIYRFGKLKEEKQLFFQKRINILEDINVLNSELTKILKNVKTIERVMDLDEAYSTSLNNAKARLNELSNRVVSCKVGDLECLNEIQSEVEKVKDNIKSVVSDVLFDARAINANLIASAKNLGVVTENVNVPRENEIEFKDLDKQLEETTRQISENLSRIRSSILNLNNILSNLLGLNLEIEGIEFYSVKDLQSRLKTIDLSNVVTELNSCISYARSSIDIIMDPKTRAELLDGLSRASLLPVSYAKFELSYNVMKKLIDNLGESLENILTSLHELEKSIQLREIEERESIVKQAISALYQNAPTCRRLKELNSYRPELMKAIDLIKSRDALLALNNLTNNILPILRAKKALPINSLGLKEEFVPIFVSLLKSKGLSVRIEGDQLVAE